MLLGGATAALAGAAAYSHADSLSSSDSKSVQEMLSGLRALHSSRHAFGAEANYRKRNSDLAGRLGNPEAATQDAVHPLVIRHPISGRRALFVNPGFTIGIEGFPTVCEINARMYNIQVVDKNKQLFWFGGGICLCRIA